MGFERVDFVFCFVFIWLDKLWYFKGFIEIELYLNLEDFIIFLFKEGVSLLKGRIVIYEEVVEESDLSCLVGVLDLNV